MLGVAGDRLDCGVFFVYGFIFGAESNQGLDL